MRNKFIVPAIVLALAATISFTGCKGRGAKNKTNQPSSGDIGSVPVGGGPGDSGSIGSRPLNPGDLKRGQFDVVYFEYDSSRVKPSEVSKIEAVATFLKAHSSVKLVIEGNADERGTAEYNRALSERRALACREELVRLGANTDNISTVGYGKEKPAITGHDEASWAKNRRCEFATAGQ